MPCQVPRASAPSITGTFKDTPVIMVLTCAGISSGPSTSWIQPASVGARRSSALARSVRTSGSAFSWMTRDADVWRMKRNRAPSFAFASAMNRATSDVISVNPSPRVSTRIFVVAMISGATLTIGDNRVLTAVSPQSHSGLVLQVFLQRHDHLDEATPYLFEEGNNLVEIGIIGQLHPWRFLLGGRRFRPDSARKRQIA